MLVMPTSGRVTVSHAGRTARSLLALPSAPLRDTRDLPQVGPFTLHVSHSSAGFHQ